MKRNDRDHTPTNGERVKFVELCIELGACDKKTILKKILRDKYAAALQDTPAGCHKTPPELPTDVHDLLRMDPSSAGFVDYTYSLCSLESQLSKKDVLEATLMKALDGMLASAINPNINPNPTTKRRKARKAPAKLSPFVLYEGTDAEETLRTMGGVVDEFFPEMSFVFPCVYADEKRTSFVLFIPDRHVNRWKASGSQCTFAWRTSEQDTNTSIFSKVVNAVPRVHVVRERKSELIYMGTCNQVDDVSSSGTCTMFVS